MQAAVADQVAHSFLGLSQGQRHPFIEVSADHADATLQQCNHCRQRHVMTSGTSSVMI